MNINPNAQLKIQLGKDGNPKILCLRYRDGTESPLRRSDCRDLHRSKKSGSIAQHSDYCRRPHGQNGGIPQ